MASNGVSVKGKVPSSQQKKVDSAGGVKRTASSESPSGSLLPVLVQLVNLKLAGLLLQQIPGVRVCWEVGQCASPSYWPGSLTQPL